MFKYGDRVKMSDAFSNNYRLPLKVGDSGIMVGDCGGTDSHDGLVRVEDNLRYRVKFDKEEVNTCDGHYPFLFKFNELELEAKEAT